jgi:hypothetical protein
MYKGGVVINSCGVLDAQCNCYVRNSYKSENSEEKIKLMHCRWRIRKENVSHQLTDFVVQGHS